jgi:hypothetical protein
LYTVFTADSNGCSNSASLLITGVTELGNDYSVSVFPNPGSGSFTVEFHGQFIDEVSIDVMNTLGQIIFSSTEYISSSPFKKEIDLDDVNPGLYLIRIKKTDSSVNQKILIVQH